MPDHQHLPGLIELVGKVGCVEHSKDERISLCRVPPARRVSIYIWDVTLCFSEKYYLFNLYPSFDLRFQQAS